MEQISEMISFGIRFIVFLLYCHVGPCKPTRPYMNMKQTPIENNKEYEIKKIKQQVADSNPDKIMSSTF